MEPEHAVHACDAAGILRTLFGAATSSSAQQSAQSCASCAPLGLAPLCPVPWERMYMRGAEAEGDTPQGWGEDRCCAADVVTAGRSASAIIS